MTRAVVSGQLRAGDRFPSVRALSQELKVNPNTAQRIVALLVEAGLLAVEPGIGTVVTATAGGRGARPARRRDGPISPRSTSVSPSRWSSRRAGSDSAWPICVEIVRDAMESVGQVEVMSMDHAIETEPSPVATAVPAPSTS